MSSSDTDEELNVSQYDVEDDLNAYGSPVHTTEAAVNALPVLPAPIHTRTQFCNCKNTCGRRSGRKKRGCPCRDEGLKCADDCTCGTKKAACNNKQETVAVSVAGTSAFERHQIAVDEAKGHITEFIGSLTEEQKDKILLEVLSNGKGSLDYAKDLVAFGGLQPPDPSQTKPRWCTCGVCQPMPTEEENKCCKKIRCVTSFVTFQNTCTDRDVLIMAIRARCDIRAEEPEYSTNSFRKAAYRQYILWRYKKLGRGNRRVCPSCVVLAIRHIYPANDGIYMGFKRA